MGLLHALTLVLLATVFQVRVESASTLDDICAACLPVSKGDKLQPLQPKAEIQPRKMFVVTHEKLSWDNAKEVCEESGMNLATIRSEEEQKKLEQLLKSKGITDEDLWLGGRDLLGTGKGGWAWNVGSQDEFFTYTHWKEGEPNNLNGNQRSLQIRTGYNYFWDDADGVAERRFVCENLDRVDQTILLKISKPKSYLVSDV